jgi:5-methylcytosine-specific restriction endonuclease McrA
MMQDGDKEERLKKKRGANREYRARDPEKWRAYAREYNRKWREENREKHIKHKREYYLRNKEKEANRQIAYQLNKRLKSGAQTRTRYITHLRKFITYWCALWLLQNPDEIIPVKLKPAPLSEEQKKARLRTTWRNCRARRRARIRAARVERVDFDLIWTRDKGICQICLKKIRRKTDLHYDHIIPLSQGGEHTYLNLVATHAGCNMRKHARVVPQQMLLLSSHDVSLSPGPPGPDS